MTGTWKCGSKKTKRYKGGEGLKWRMVNPFASVRPWSPLAVFPFPPSHLCSTKHGMQCSTSQYNLVFTPFELAVFPESAFLSSSNLSFFSRQIFLSSTPPSPYLSKACTPTLKVPDSLFISLASGYFFLFFFLVFEIHLQISSSHSSTAPPPKVLLKALGFRKSTTEHLEGESRFLLATWKRGSDHIMFFPGFA